MKEREKCNKTSHHQPQYTKWFLRYSISKSGIWARWIGFQPHFHLSMTSQTQWCDTMKNESTISQELFI